MPCNNPDAGGMDGETYQQYIDKLKNDNYDGIIIFCHTEFEFYNLPRYEEIVDISRQKNILINVIVGLDIDYNNNPHLNIPKCGIPDNINVIYWPTNFGRETLEQICHWYNTNNRGIKDISEIFIDDLDKLNYNYHYVYLNNKSHIWRSALIDTVAKNDLLKYSAYSWHAEYMGNNPYVFKYYDGSLKILDNQYANKKDQGWVPEEYYQSFFQLVPESTLKCHFITEKTFTPLIIGKPFLIAGSKGINKKLESLGFQLYTELFDYSFDDVEDMQERYDQICEQIKIITSIPLNELSKYHETLKDKIKYNRRKVFELAFDKKHMPQLAQDVIDYYDKTGKKLDWWLLETELRLRDLKDKYRDRLC
jgi:hypothetical protein